MPKNLNHLPEFYRSYVNLVPEDEMLQAIINSGQKISNFLDQLPEKSGDFQYEKGKWTVKQVISHFIDAERIFAYRALRFSRNDHTPLPGFDENNYVPESNASNRKVTSLANEFKNLRRSTIDLFESFSKDMLARHGDANGQKISVEATGFVIAGHALHHYNILKERYTL